jgi:hypothetical protein
MWPPACNQQCHKLSNVTLSTATHGILPQHSPCKVQTHYDPNAPVCSRKHRQRAAQPTWNHGTTAEDAAPMSDASPANKLPPTFSPITTRPCDASDKWHGGVVDSPAVTPRIQQHNNLTNCAPVSPHKGRARDTYPNMLGCTSQPWRQLHQLRHTSATAAYA